MRDWNEHYRDEANLESEPHPVLVKAAGLLAPGRALDLACGAGRHAIYLARRGWQVTAVDSSPVALDALRCRGGGLPVHAAEADLENGGYAIVPGAFDLICDFFYLHRPLLPAIRAGIRPGGLFAATIHMADTAPGARPRNPAFVLQPGELLSSFAGWQILHSWEGHEPGHRRRTAELIARKPAE